jgi:hypothetical protein
LGLWADVLIATRLVMEQAVNRVPSIVDGFGAIVVIRILPLKKDQNSINIMYGCDAHRPPIALFNASSEGTIAAEEVAACWPCALAPTL